MAHSLKEVFCPAHSEVAFPGVVVAFNRQALDLLALVQLQAPRLFFPGNHKHSPAAVPASGCLPALAFGVLARRRSRGPRKGPPWRLHTHNTIEAYPADSSDLGQ